MSSVTKKQKIIQEKLDPEKSYSITEAMEIIQSVKSEKFDESIDISVKLGVDPNKSDQNVRGAVTLPNSLGKAVTVAVFADGDHADAAKDAGAEFIGMDDLAEKFTKEEVNVDVVISTNAAMKVVGKLGPSLPTTFIAPFVEITTSTSISSFVNFSAKSSIPTYSAPAISASLALSPSAKTATLTSFPRKRCQSYSLCRW